MHMADALISPSVGGVFWAASCFVASSAAKRIKAEGEDARNVFMGVLAAFVFAAQMINFSIPGTGSSGHIGGGVLLALFLGRERAFLSMAVILSVQALVFADGGLLALGCNLFNLAFLPCYIAYPLIYKRLTRGTAGKRREFAALVITSIAALELGALSVVLQTVFSGISMIPFVPFAALMLPVHLAIAVAEGFMTALVAAYVRTNEPSLLAGRGNAGPASRLKPRKALAVIAGAALFVGGIFSWYASPRPDGLEWSLERVADGQSASTSGFFHSMSARLQEKAAFLPGYSFKNGGQERLGITASGVAGSCITLVMAAGAALLFSRRSLRK